MVANFFSFGLEPFSDGEANRRSKSSLMEKIAEKLIRCKCLPRPIKSLKCESEGLDPVFKDTQIELEGFL